MSKPIQKQYEVYYSWAKRPGQRMERSCEVYAADIEELHAKNKAWLESNHGLGDLQIHHIKEIVPKIPKGRTPPDRIVGGQPFWYEDGDPRQRAANREPKQIPESKANKRGGLRDDEEIPECYSHGWWGGTEVAQGAVELISPEPHAHEPQNSATMPPDASGSETALPPPQKPRRAQRAPAKPRRPKTTRKPKADSPPDDHPSPPADPE